MLYILKPHFLTDNIILANNINLLANIFTFKIDTANVKNKKEKYINTWLLYF